MKSNKGVIFLVFTVVVLLLLKYFFFPGGEAEQSGPAPGGPPPPVSVEGYVVEYQTLDNTLQVTGTVLPNEVVDLRPEIGGKIEMMNIDEGQQVSKGALLVKLNDRDLQAQLRKVKAQFKLSQSRQLRLAELLRVQGVSQQEYDEAVNQTDALSADIEVLMVQIQRTEIHAPFSGVLGLRNCSVGSYVTPNDIIVGIRQLDPIKIEFSVPGRYAGMIKAGQEIDFFLEEDNVVRNAKVYAFESGMNESTRMLKVKALSPNPNNSIKSGSFVKVSMILQKMDDAIMLPTQAIIPVLKGQQVFLSKMGKAEPLMIETGIREEKQIQITKGLVPGDTVIVSGVMGVRPGSVLRWTNFKK